MQIPAIFWVLLAASWTAVFIIAAIIDKVFF